MTRTTLPVSHSGVGGRPKYSAAVRNKFLRGLRMGMTRPGASGLAGIHHSTAYDWIAKDPEFAEQVEIAENEAEARYSAVPAALSTASTPPSVRLRAAEFWLDRRRPKEWRERTSIEITLPPEVERARSDVTDDELDARLLALGEELVRRGRDRTRGRTEEDEADPEVGG